jgi:hypothetical protein
MQIDLPDRLLSRRANAGQTLRDARIQAHDSGGKLIHGRNQRESNGCDDQGVFNQILTLFVTDQSKNHLLHMAGSSKLHFNSTASLPRPAEPSYETRTGGAPAH